MRKAPPHSEETKTKIAEATRRHWAEWKATRPVPPERTLIKRTAIARRGSPGHQTWWEALVRFDFFAQANDFATSQQLRIGASTAPTCNRPAP